MKEAVLEFLAKLRLGERINVTRKHLLAPLERTDLMESSLPLHKHRD